MHRQNRVDPQGALVAVAARGTLMGNRGCLHDDGGHIVRQSARDAWVTCLLSFKDRQRQIMQPGHYTELFFLDEATALAAGHRPLFRVPAGTLCRVPRGMGAGVRAGKTSDGEGH